MNPGFVFAQGNIRPELCVWGGGGGKWGGRASEGSVTCAASYQGANATKPADKPFAIFHIRDHHT